MQLRWIVTPPKIVGLRVCQSIDPSARFAGSIAIIEINRLNDGTVALSFRHMDQLHQISSGPRLRTPKRTAVSLELGAEVMGVGKAWQ